MWDMAMIWQWTCAQLLKFSGGRSLRYADAVVKCLLDASEFLVYLLYMPFIYIYLYFTFQVEDS